MTRPTGVRDQFGVIHAASCTRPGWTTKPATLPGTTQPDNDQGEP